MIPNALRKILGSAVLRRLCLALSYSRVSKGQQVDGRTMDVQEDSNLEFVVFPELRLREQGFREFPASMVDALGNDEEKPVGVGGPGIYGYDHNPLTGERTINVEEALVVRGIFEWDAAGWTSKAIAQELNERGVPTRSGAPWSARMVRCVLRHRPYTGRVRYGKYDCPGVRPRYAKNAQGGWMEIESGGLRIVSDEAFENAARRGGVSRAIRRGRHDVQ